MVKKASKQRPKRHLRLPVTETEEAAVKAAAAEREQTLTAYMRDKLGLPPMPRGRPPKQA